MLCWVPGHAGVKGNETADSVEKETLNNNEIDVNVALGRVELGEIIKEGMMTEWQRLWQNDSTGRHYFSFQPQVKSVCHCRDGNRGDC